MNRLLLLTMLFCCCHGAIAQQVTYDEKLARSLGADERGMKKYVFCLLKTGSNTIIAKADADKAFEGHMANIGRLAKEGKLVVAGPFMQNDRNYRGIFIFNAQTIEEARAYVDSDPAVKAGLLEPELTQWYASAALMEVTAIHNKITKSKY